MKIINHLLNNILVMMKILKYISLLIIFLFIYSINNFSYWINTHVSNPLNKYTSIAKKLTKKVLVMINEKNINLEVFIQKVEWLSKDKKYSSNIRNVLSEVNNQLKNKVCSDYYPVHKNIVASVFWIWEEANSSNAYITNNVSAWDVKWVKHFNQWVENEFYFALPYNDLNNNWKRKKNSKDIPWYDLKKWKNNESVVKNRWVKITHKWKTAYAQWEDVWPLRENDINYVFWNNAPKNTFSLKAWIDLSPSVSDYLWIDWEWYVDWNFIPDYCVTEWIWTETITNTDIIWK